MSYAQEADVDTRAAADINADGLINILDLTHIAAHFGETDAPAADVNADGLINILDLTLVARYFGQRSGIPVHATDETFDDIVLGAELPVVVEFKSDFCGFCIQMRPIVAEVASEYRDVFSIVKLDVNTDRIKTIEYGIRGTPTYIVFREGQQLQSLIGAMPKDTLVQRILGILEIEETE